MRIRAIKQGESRYTLETPGRRFGRRPRSPQEDLRFVTQNTERGPGGVHELSIFERTKSGVLNQTPTLADKTGNYPQKVCSHLASDSRQVHSGHSHYTRMKCRGRKGSFWRTGTVSAKPRRTPQTTIKCNGSGLVCALFVRVSVRGKKKENA